MNLLFQWVWNFSFSELFQTGYFGLSQELHNQYSIMSKNYKSCD